MCQDCPISPIVLHLTTFFVICMLYQAKNKVVGEVLLSLCLRSKMYIYMKATALIYFLVIVKDNISYLIFKINVKTSGTVSKIIEIECRFTSKILKPIRDKPFSLRGKVLEISFWTDAYIM